MPMLVSLMQLFRPESVKIVILDDFSLIFIFHFKISSYLCRALEGMGQCRGATPKRKVARFGVNLFLRV